jgi:hypothetical protein
VSERLLGLAEIAENLKVSKRTALKYSQRADFPAPVAKLASGPVWDADSVERWADATLPLRRGRPRSSGDG